MVEIITPPKKENEYDLLNSHGYFDCLCKLICFLNI
jgi:hypothetical protein